MINLPIIGSIGNVDIRYCVNTDRFVFLDLIATAILESFEHGAFPEDVRGVLKSQDAQQASVVDVIWDAYLSATRILPKEDVSSIDIISRNNVNDFDYLNSSTLIVDCGTVIVQLVATEKAANLLFPLVKKYYGILPENSLSFFENKIYLNDQSDGSIVKLVQSTSYICPYFEGEYEDVFVKIFSDLTEIASIYDRAIAVVHAATLIRHDKTIILTNPSGSGKTTFSWLLANSGYDMVHDDVLPINRDGSLAQLCTPSTLKSGSWEVLSDIGLKLYDHIFDRNGLKIKFYPISKLSSKHLSRNRHLVFVVYDTEHDATIKEISVLDAFKRVIEEECVIRDKSIDSLKSLVEWVVECRCATLNYSNNNNAVLALNHWLESDNEVNFSMANSR